jgi:hypothetical protein
MTLEDAILEAATAPDQSAYAARRTIRAADPDARVYELRDGLVWVGIGHGENWPTGPDWMTLADWAELVS